MKRIMRWNYFFCCILVCFFFAGAVFISDCKAEENRSNGPVTVRDDASLLMEEEADWLKDIAQKLADKSGWNVIVATCDKATGRTAQATCEDYFNTYTTGDDGICCLVDMANREIYLSTAGRAISYLTDDKIDDILEDAGKAAGEEDYAQCLYLMLLGSDEAYEAGGTGKMISFAGSLTAMGIILAIVFGRLFLKRKNGGQNALRTDPYGTNTAARAARQAARRSRMRNRTGSTAGRSRSTVHRGLGGRKFGGGGRKF